LSGWFVLSAIAWSVVVIGSLLWNISVEYEHAIGEATTEARANFDKNRAFRLWAASHGGVYVPVDENTQPNPDLKSLPGRDLVTTTGLRLTLMNPSAMIRQMKGGGEGSLAVKEKLTTFPDKLLDQVNMPDDWELKALKSLKQGAKEVKEITQIDGATYMRLIKPLYIEQGCLNCHGGQGYQVGDLSGGLGVAIPLAPYIKHQSDQSTLLSVSYLLIWLLGLTGIYYAFRINRIRSLERTRLISELQEMNIRLEKYSYQDGLTQVANRRMFDTLLEREWARARREQHPLALIMIDIDFFKFYNDGYGHQAGDDCLKRIATTLDAVSRRSTDLVARYGGEEFMILLPNTDNRQAQKLAEQCRSDVAALQIPHASSDAADVVTISVGVATMLPSSEIHASDLVKAADQALYRAKDGGRNRVKAAP